MVFPVLVSVMPHDVNEAIHQSKVHVSPTHHAEHDNHLVSTDIVMIYGEYLHVDLKQVDDENAGADYDLIKHEYDFDLTSFVSFNDYLLSSIRTRAPPLMVSAADRVENVSIYLSTQRLRI